MDEKGDVSLLEDLFFGIKNLVALEDHAKTSYYTTNDNKWLEIGNFTRQVRTRWMQMFVKKDDGHVWCSSKHIPAIIMSAQEVSNRLLSNNQQELAKEFEEEAKIFSGMVFLLNDLKSKSEEVKI